MLRGVVQHPLTLLELNVFEVGQVGCLLLPGFDRGLPFGE